MLFWRFDPRTLALTERAQAACMHARAKAHANKQGGCTREHKIEHKIVCVCVCVRESVCVCVSECVCE